MTHLNKSELALYAGGDLEPEQRIAAERHLSQCLECSRSLEDFESSRTWFCSLATEPDNATLSAVHASVIARVSRQPKFTVANRTWAAALAALLTIGVFSLWNVGRRDNRAPQPERTTAVLVPKQPAVPSPEPRSKLVSVTQALRHARRVPASTSGMRSISVIEATTESPVLKLKTADPNVVILWVVNTTPEQNEVRND